MVMGEGEGVRVMLMAMVTDITQASSHPSHIQVKMPTSQPPHHPHAQVLEAVGRSLIATGDLVVAALKPTLDDIAQSPNLKKMAAMFWVDEEVGCMQSRLCLWIYDAMIHLIV